MSRRTSEEGRRNLPAIVDALVVARRDQPRAGASLALEVGSGSGEHAVALSRRFPELEWQPSDPDPVQRASISAWIAHDRALRVRAPLDLDVARAPWPIAPPLALILAVHVLHIAPIEAIAALGAEAGRLLAPHGLVVVHDAFLDADGRAPSRRMADFDRSLAAREPRAGLRPRQALERALNGAGLTLAHERTGPEDDLVTLVFQRT